MRNPCRTNSSANHVQLFEHQPITDKWAERVASAHARDGTIETILVRGKFKFLRLGSVFRRTIHNYCLFIRTKR